jgi:exodeoxyribonuclease-5
MNWSPQQDAALAAVSRWMRERSSPFFYLAGYAGTGKTTLAKHFAEDVGGGGVLFASFTGKAAAVMRNKGCTEATTIHRLIYTAREKGSARLKDLREKLDNTTDERELERIRRQIRDEVKALRAPNFVLNPESPVRSAGLVVIDECSMVNGRMADDLLSFGVPVLVLGDPAQLPPVGGGGYFTEREPNHMLTEVHRQAAESAIIRLATDVRQGRALEFGEYGDARVLRRGTVDPQQVLAFEQVLVGRNGTRRATNRRVRDLLGRISDLPQPGDRLVCLRNNHDIGLLNGEIWNTLDSAVLDDATLGLTIENGDLVENVTAWAAPFRGEELGQWDHDRDVQEFDYGYVLTVHKAQGSQWPRVFVFDESGVFRQHAKRWLYTAITRAANELVVVQ